MTTSTSRPALIGHRGYPRRYPENTPAGFAAALDAGADGIELDVQLSADGVPVVVHDESLRRTAGRDVLVGALDAAALGLPTLAGLMHELAARPGVPVFVELKRESLRRAGVSAMVAAVLDALGAAITRCIVISFDADALVAARAGGASIGWVLDAWSDDVRAAAERMGPDYLVCDVALVPPAPAGPWPGPWEWVVYGVNDAELALALGARGIGWVETDTIGELREHPAFGGDSAR